MSGSKPLCLKHHFLVAMPQLKDPHFSSSLVYLCEHTPEGAMGIVVNRPTSLRVSEMIDQFGLPEPTPDPWVYAGGPVQVERGFVLHDGEGSWQSTLGIADEIRVTTSRDVLEAISAGEGPEHYLIALGYAGWSEGQLEEELASNAWISCPADFATLFQTSDEQKVPRALGTIGIDPRQLTSSVGHG